LKILAIAANFPSKSKPYNGIFVKNLLVEFARLGHEVSVIAPQKTTEELMPKEVNDGGMRIFRPRFISFGNVRVLGFKTRLLSHLSFKLSVLLFVLRKKLSYDAIYSHFLFPSGDSAALISKWSGRPAVCSLGESTFEAYERDYSPARIRKAIDAFGLAFPNSRDKLDALNRKYGGDIKRLQYVANGVDTNVFFPVPKAEARLKLGLSVQDRIVLFVGGFIERKGPLRVLEACKQLANVPKMIFIGEGTQEFEHPQIVFSGKAQQNELRLYLNAADVFVSPSRKEGMPNAMLEAMACSCRIVASDIPVHRDLLEEYEGGALCNGEERASLASAIDRMLNSGGGVIHGEFQYSLEKRAQAILKGIETSL
jgi:glycosyltransferase involved in cell wall biosynthesis